MVKKSFSFYMDASVRNMMGRPDNLWCGGIYHQGFIMLIHTARLKFQSFAEHSAALRSYIRVFQLYRTNVKHLIMACINFWHSHVFLLSETEQTGYCVY